jgi:hypothetical protein
VSIHQVVLHFIVVDDEDMNKLQGRGHRYILLG